jgi:hypothetical protein
MAVWDFLYNFAPDMIDRATIDKIMEATYTITAHLTPAVSKADGLDYIVMPGWKIFMILISRQMLHLPEPLAYGLGIACLVVAAVWFTIWYNKQERNQQ